MKRLACLIFALFAAVTPSAEAVMMGTVIPEKGSWRAGAEFSHISYDLDRDNLPADRAQGSDFAVHGLVHYGVTDWLELGALAGYSEQDLVDKTDPTGASLFDFNGGAAPAWGLKADWLVYRKRYVNVALRGGYYEHGDHETRGAVSPSASNKYWHGWGAVQLQANNARRRGLWSYIGARYSETRIDFNSVGVLGSREYESRTKVGIYGGLGYEFAERWEASGELSGGDENAVSLRVMRRF